MAYLIGASKVTLTVDGNTSREAKSLPRCATRRSTPMPSSPRRRPSTTESHGISEILHRLLDDANAPKDPPELARYGADKLRSKHDELESRHRRGIEVPVRGTTQRPHRVRAGRGQSDDWYLNEFTMGDAARRQRETCHRLIQSFLNGTQRNIYDDAAALLTNRHSSNLNYLPPGTDESVRAALADPNAFRGNKMAQLKQATDTCAQSDDVVTATRAAVTTAVEQRKAELVAASDFYSKATPVAQQDVLQTIESTLTRVRDESQVALIQQIATDFENNTYPALLDQLANSQQGGGGTPMMQTVSIKTVSVRPGVRRPETDSDIDAPHRSSCRPSYRPSGTESGSHSDGHCTAENLRRLGSNHSDPRGRCSHRGRAGAGLPQRVEQPKAVAALEAPSAAGAGGGG